MGIGGGTTAMRSTVRLNRHETRIPLSYSFFSGPYFREALSDSLIIRLITGRKNQGGKRLSYKGIPRWSLLTIVIPVLHTHTQLALG